jgi:hypothetical protein
MLGRARRTGRGREDLLAATEGFKVRVVVCARETLSIVPV